LLVPREVIEDESRDSVYRRVDLYSQLFAKPKQGMMNWMLCPMGASSVYTKQGPVAKKPKTPADSGAAPSSGPLAEEISLTIQDTDEAGEAITRDKMWADDAISIVEDILKHTVPAGEGYATVIRAGFREPFSFLWLKSMAFSAVDRAPTKKWQTARAEIRKLRIKNTSSTLEAYRSPAQPTQISSSRHSVRKTTPTTTTILSRAPRPNC